MLFFQLRPHSFSRIEVIANEGLDLVFYMRVDDACSVPVHCIPGVCISRGRRVFPGAIDNCPCPISLEQCLDVEFPGMVVVLIKFCKDGGRGIGGRLFLRHDAESGQTSGSNERRSRGVRRAMEGRWRGMGRSPMQKSTKCSR